jgi:integrase
MSSKSSPAPLVADAENRIVRKKLADGTVKEYLYPRRKIDKTPRFAADSLDGLVAAYRRSPEFAALSASTLANYQIYLRDLAPIGHLKVADINRKKLLHIRDAIATRRGSGAATGFQRVTSSVLSWAVDRDWIDFNPLARAKTLPGGSFPTWTEAEVETALTKLDEPFRRVVVLALHTGQRRGDLIAMTWAAYDGATIRLRQQKAVSRNGEAPEMVIPCHPDLCAELDAWKKDRTSTHLLTGHYGKPWTAGNLSREMDKRLRKIGLRDRLSLHGLRKVAAKRLAEAGCSVHEIAAITGHRTIAMVQHYTVAASQGRLAEAAISRLPVKGKKRP